MALPSSLLYVFFRACNPTITGFNIGGRFRLPGGMAMIRSIAHILSFMILLAAAGGAQAAGKAALVIGNSAYRHVTALTNPANDAEDMAASLLRIGYQVTLVKDGDLKGMNDGLRTFLRDADRAESALIFYSGHGVQVKGRNYLVPVSAEIGDELDLDTQTMSLDKLLELLDGAGPKVKIVILDSCRDNPLTKMLVRGSGTRGLARIDLEAGSAKGTLIAFSTSPGSVAQDGTGRNSPFTTALLAHIETPDLDVRQMFGQVREDVDASTQGGQTPWVNEAIIGSFAMTGTVPRAGKLFVVSKPSAEAVDPPVEEPARTEQAASEPAIPIPDVPPKAGPAGREYIIADSDRRLLTYDEISGFSLAQLRVARNEIFARKGRFMKDAQLKAYFAQFAWYQPFTWTVKLSRTETANVALIQQVEAGR
jgi:hypothetical protein